jgi:hypothetical protein
MKTKKDNEIIEVFVGTSMDAEIVRSLLEDSDIKTFLKDDNMGTIAPWHVSAGGAGAVKIIINSNDYDKAKLIIEKYEKSKK